MRRVAIAGVGITPRTRTYLSQADRKSWKEYVADAAYDAIANVKRGLHPKDIQYVVVNYHGEASVEAGGIGPVVSDALGEMWTMTLVLASIIISWELCFNRSILRSMGSGPCWRRW